MQEWLIYSLHAGVAHTQISMQEWLIRCSLHARVVYIYIPNNSVHAGVAHSL